MVDVKELVKKYGEFTAVDQVSFHAQKGEVFVLLGPNGCGKTTILRVVMGLLKPTLGAISIGGIDIKQQPLMARRLTSYLPQQTSLPENLTGNEILQFYCNIRGVNANSRDHVFSLKGMENFLEKPIGEYSGGMQQRLALAVALLPRTEILILDEPTVNLDPEGVSRFRQTIRDLKYNGKTVILATHLLSESEALADRVAVMFKGRIISLKSMKEMKEEILPTFKLHVSVSDFSEKFIKLAKENGAMDLEQEGRELTFSTANPGDRLRIINALEKAGAQIERFGTIEPPLEEVYMKILQERGI